MSSKESFLSKMDQLIKKADARKQAAFVNSAAHAFRSIVHGSSTTGAPGQVVQDVGGGTLRDSWQLQFPTKSMARITTDVAWAESNEDGIARPGGGPYIQRSAVGGRHSIAKTIDGLPDIVAYEASRLGEATYDTTGWGYGEPDNG